MVQGIFNVIYTLAYNALMECNLYQPKVSRYSTIGYDEIVAFAAKAASIPESDMRMTMEALMEAGAIEKEMVARLREMILPNVILSAREVLKVKESMV